MCGEKSGSGGLPPHVMGSPPRVRGEEYVQSGKEDAVRITPACAGRSF